MDFSEPLEKLLIYIVPALCGILLHEIAHGYVAWRLGDPTARALGRLSLNPLPHIDPVGLLVFVITSLSGSFVFGWAKPVPIDPRYFASPRKGMMWVALAGPMTNFFLAVCFALLLRGSITLFPTFFLEQHPAAILFGRACYAGVFINLGLGWLNLIPVPPLDGSRIVAYFLPARQCATYMQIERYGFLVLLLLLIFGLLDTVLRPLVFGSADALLSLLQLR